MYHTIFNFIHILFISIYYFIHIRGPDFVVYNENGEIYLRRWHIYRSSPTSYFKFNIYIHNFLKSDEDRALHDHPWPSLGILLYGTYNEYVPKNVKKWIEKGDRRIKILKRYPFIPIYRKAEYIHMIKLNGEGTTSGPEPVWTLFITGKKMREWGFWCPNGWVHNRGFLSEDGSSKGIGCN